MGDKNKPDVKGEELERCAITGFEACANTFCTIPSQTPCFI